ASAENAAVTVPALLARLDGGEAQAPTPGNGSAPAAARGSEAPVAASDTTVRIATAKLDALLAQIGELQVSRIGTEQRLLDLRALLTSVEAWEGQWRKVRTQYLRVLDWHSAVLTDSVESAGSDARVLEEFV